MSHVCNVRRTKRLGIHVGVVEFSIYLARFDLAEGDLLLDIFENHEEVLVFLCVAGVTVGHGDDRAVVFHDDGRKFQGYMEFLAQCDKEVEFFGKIEDGSCFGMC